MQCAQCGSNNTEEPTQCAQCGAILKASRPRKRLVAGLISASVALAVCAALFMLWAFQLHSDHLDSVFAQIAERAEEEAAEYNIAGIWYEPDGYGTIEFFKDGSLVFVSFGISISGTYDYDSFTRKGEIRLDTETVDEVTMLITLGNGSLDIDGVLYTTDYVEQKEIDWEDLLGGFSD